jgi:hypothetical protein
MERDTSEEKTGGQGVDLSENLRGGKGANLSEKKWRGTLRRKKQGGKELI